MSSIISNAISGLPINNGSSISINFGRTSRNYIHYNNANLKIEDVDKFQDKFHHDYIQYALWPPYATSGTNIPDVTPSPTRTTTPTITLSPSVSVTETPLITSSPSSTPNSTATPTSTPTSTVTPTSTTTITPTPTSTVTTTATPTPTVSPVPLIMSNTANFGNCAGTLTNVGTNGIASYYGAYDFSGNVWEWLETPVGASNRVFRGGNYSYNVNYLSSSYRNYAANTSRLSYLGFRIASSQLSNIYPNMVYVGDINNTADANGFGNVNYGYYIGEYEVTNSEYVEFLNAVAATDTYSLYTNNMSSTSYGGILRSGSVGSYTYTTKNNMGNRPVNYVNWSCGARYANWLHNGKPSGSQTTNTTENGTYDMTTATTLRNGTGTYFLCLENEWYKAAFYKGNGANSGYWTYPTQSNSAPTCVTVDSNGDAIIP